MKIILALILAFTTLTSFADQLQGKVVTVTDGDTVGVLTNDNVLHKIRLSGIDAPEKKQAFGNKSKQALDDEIGGKVVTVEFSKLDRYQRIIGKIMMSGQDVNLHQIQRGLAWHYKKYQNEQEVADRSIYANAEYVAQRDKLGLWSEPNSTPPWDFRKHKREAN